MQSVRNTVGAACALWLLAGCGGAKQAPPAGETAAPITNRIEVPPAVVENLGITYAPARRAKLERWLHLTGELEVAADRTHELRAPAEGRFRLAAKRWDTVQAGDVIGTLTAPALKQAQAGVASALADQTAARTALDRLRAQQPALKALAGAKQRAVETARARLDGLRGLLESARALDARCEARLESIRELASSSSVASKQLHDAERERHEAQEKLLNAAQAVSEGEVALRRTEVESAAATVDASAQSDALQAAQLRLNAATFSLQAALVSLSQLTGTLVTELTPETDGTPAWQRLDALEIRAPANGVIDSLAAADGRWVEAGEVLAVVVDAGELRFRGRCPEDDLERIPAGAEVRIEVARAGREPIVTKLIWPPRVADPVARTVLLEAAVPNTGDAPLPRGLSAAAAVLIGRSEMAEVLIPAAAVTRDGLELLVFRRNPDNPNQVIRTPVTVGARTKEWVEVISGVSAKDQLVISGVQQLKRSGAGKGKPGGHFHADGTYHDKPH